MDPEEQQDLTVVDGCDESKCVSRGMSNLYNNSFTCYGDDGSFFPMMCADGFLPVIAKDEPSRASLIDIDGSKTATVRYFTCCPPYNDVASESTATDDTAIVRHCSDPITVPNAIGAKVNNDESTSTVCNNIDGRNHPRRMKPYGDQNYDSFVCCDSATTVESYYFYDDDDLNNSTIASKFLDDAECVPYRNEFYDAAKVENEIGKICPIVCDFVEGDFLFPRPLDNASAGHYQCCKNGPALQPYIRDSAFWKSLYPIVALWCLTAVVSAILVIGLLIPFLSQLKNGQFRRQEIRRSSASRRKPPYSTYNLYVVFLALLDLAWALCAIGLYSRIINQNYNPNFYGVVVSPSCSSDRERLQLIPELVLTMSPYTIGNFWINALISYEVLILLKNSKGTKRINQPSLKKVCLQVSAIYLLIALSISVFFFTLEDRPEIFTTGIVLILGPAFLYIVYAPIWTCWRGYMPSLNGATLRDKAMRELAFYFFRIIAVFLCIWFPTFYVNAIALTGQYWAWVLFMCLFAIQPLATACCILTKSDSRKYILDLVTLSYLKADKRMTMTPTARYSQYVHRLSTTEKASAGLSAGTDKDNVDVTGVSNDDDEDALIFSVLGFTLADANPDADIDADADADDTELNGTPNIDSHRNSEAKESIEIVFDAESDDEVPRRVFIGEPDLSELFGKHPTDKNDSAPTGDNLHKAEAEDNVDIVFDAGSDDDDVPRRAFIGEPDLSELFSKRPTDKNDSAITDP